jgi:hypothetical protein
MKGTLFSADFIEEANGNIRLLEINTDTAIQDGGLEQLDFSGFHAILSGSELSGVTIIHKHWHNNLVTAISGSLHQSASFITDFQTILEEGTTIYPTSVEDSPNRFILRMTYDESAIFDSEYAKDKKAVLKLFSDSGDSGSIAEYYISSSDGVSDFLPLDLNSTNIPDVVVKDLNINVNNPLQFYKIGKSTETLENRYSEFKQQLGENNLILKYYENPSDIKVKSIRSLNIIYGGNLDVVNLGNFIGEGLFEKPTSIEYDDNVIGNKIDIKHYYELATSYPRFNTIDNWGGIFEEEEIVKADGSTVLIASASIGDEFKSYYIEGAPDTDIVSEFMGWSYSGSELPTGSHVTSSILINNIQQPLTYGIIYHVTLEDASDFRAAVGSHLLTYDVQLDCIRYSELYELTPETHKLINLSGGTVDIQSITIDILDGQYHANILDMETADTFFLSNGELSVKIVTHNCFPAGTKITLADGSQKNIEELTIEDKILTWNEHTGELVEGTIGNIVKKTDNLLIHLITENGDVKSTPFHKFYVKDKKWTPAQDIVIGDVLLNEEGKDVAVTDRIDLVGNVDVYHILDVKDNHTYFANNLLVHNIKYGCFVAGTEITLANGDVKNIEDVIVGEEVLTYNEVSGEPEVGVVGNLKQHEVHSVVKLIFDNEVVITTTSEHPFFVDGKGFIPAGNLQLHDVCKKVNGNNSILTSIEVLEESHVVYNLLSVSENHNFYANGILVHNKL